MKVHQYLLMIIMLYPMSIMAKDATTIITINGMSLNPTCSVNNNEGLSQAIDMGSYTALDVVNGHSNLIDIPLHISCFDMQGVNGVILELSPLSDFSEVGIVQPGAIQTSLDGVSILLRWKSNNNPVNFNNGTKFPYSNSNIFDGSMTAQISAIPGFSQSSIGKGMFKSAINITMHYY